MALGISVAVALGRTALLGFQTKMAGVLYLAFEDSEPRIQGRLRKLAAGDVPENLHFITSCPPMHQGGLDHLSEWLSCHREVELIIVDTLGRFRPPQKSGANVYLDDYSVGAQLKALADKHHVALLMIHHTRKAPADDPIMEVSGSTGLTGAADTIWVLKRPKRTGADAVLFVTGRDIEERELALKFDPQTGKYSTVGDAGDLARSKIRNAILQVLRKEERPMTPTEVAASLNKDFNTVKQRMYQMMKDGELRQPERGKYIPA
jgi:RecA-family ATPase